jgi:hypothetical protein
MGVDHLEDDSSTKDCGGVHHGMAPTLAVG